MSITGKRFQRVRRRLGGGRGPGGRVAVGLLAVAAIAAVALGGSPAALASAAAPAPAAQPAAARPAAVQPADVPAAPSGFTTTWSDDFSGAANTGLNTDTWRYDAGAGWTFGTGEIETMTNSTANVYQDGNGHLVLKALHTGTDPNANWTSGRVETQADGFGAKPGGVVRMQASIQQPNLNTTNGAGYWPAFWMLGAPLRVGVTWPGSGEVDIMEDINARSSVFGTLHCGVGSGGPCNETSGIGSGERACAGCQTGYHTYAVEIDRSVQPEQIRYYLDGANYFTLNSGQVDATTWANAVDHSFYIIFDLAIGGGFPAAFGGGPTAATASGGQLNVDYVAVYNKGPALGTNIAQGKPTTASSSESATFPASNATDGDVTTRWSSGFSDPQWLQRRHQLDDGLLQQQQPTGHPGHRAVRVGTLRPGLRDRPGLPVRRLALRVGAVRHPGLRRRHDRRDHRRHRRHARPALAGEDRHRVLLGERQLHRTDGGRRQRRHPLVQRLLRPAVAAGRPRREPHHQPGGAQLGDRVRHGLPDPDVERRGELDDRLQHHHRHRRQPDPERLRHRPVRAPLRHAPLHAVRLLALGVPGLRHLTTARHHPGTTARPGRPARRGGRGQTETSRTRSPQSLTMSSTSEVRSTTGRCCRSAASATTASMAYSWPCSPAPISSAEAALASSSARARCACPTGARPAGSGRSCRARPR
jgi:beta-glucanase (GH16 family)